MIFLYLLTALSLYFAFKGYKNKFFQNDNLWAETELIEPKKLINKTDWWKQSKIINALTQPGWFVKTFTTKRLIFQLSRQTIQFSPEQLWRLKQGAFSVAGILFIAWLWFGDFTIKDLWLYLGMWLLVTFMPDLYALQKLTKQNQRISADVPSFLDLLTLTLKSGVNLERALLLTTQNFASPLSTIVAEKLKELDWGRSLEAVFEDLKFEVEDDDFKHFLGSVIRTKNLGVSLSETLAIQSELLRTRRRQKAEELSRTASVKISVPLVLFIFPALLIIYIGPGILQLLAKT